MVILITQSKITAHLLNTTHDLKNHSCQSERVLKLLESLTQTLSNNNSDVFFVVLFSDQVTCPVICSPLMTTRPLTAGPPTPSSLDCHTDPVPTQRPSPGPERVRRALCSAVPHARSSQRKSWRPCARQTGRDGMWWSGCLTPAVNGAAVRAKSARYVKGLCDTISPPFLIFYLHSSLPICEE